MKVKSISTTGPDTRDGKMYVVTEVADYSLKDYLGQKLEEKSALKPDSIRQICRSFVVAMAMLHAKGSYVCSKAQLAAGLLTVD